MKKPKAYLLTDHGVYNEMDMDFYLSALWRDLNRLLHDSEADIDDVKCYYPTLHEFMRLHDSIFVDSYEKMLKDGEPAGICGESGNRI